MLSKRSVLPILILILAALACTTPGTTAATPSTANNPSVDQIQTAILTLAPDQRAALVMIDVQGMSYEETAQATGASIGTVKSRLSRARRRVREQLKQNVELLPDQFRQIERGT